MIRRLHGPASGDARDIDRELVIGRADADVQLEDPEVSRRHAAVRPVERGVEVEDLGSSNGTFVDGQRVAGRQTVGRGATLRVGTTELRLEVELPDVTRVRPVAGPDVTVQRPVARPDVTVARQAAPPPPPPPSGPPPPNGPPPPREPAAPGQGGRRRSLVFLGAGLLAGAAIAAGVIALVSGGSSSSTPSSTAAAGTPRCAARFPPVIHDGFPEPKMRFSHDGVLDTSLHMAPAKITTGGVTYDTGFEYDKQLPGPMLVFCPGDKVTLHLFNGLPIPTNLHVHGLHVSPDGNGDNIFVDVTPLSERTYQYQIPLDQFPGFYWYHPHLHPLVEPEEAGGLAGAIVVEGSLDDRLPKVPQRFIVIQGGNRRTKPSRPPPPGVAGKHPPVGVPDLLVNGVQNPTLRIQPGQIQRWRILNATSDRLMDLEMPGVTFQVLAQDGITLRDMLPEKRLLIAPGSRVEVLVRGGPKGLYTLSALPFHQCHKGCNPFAGPTTGVTTPKEDLITMVSTGPRLNDQMPTGAIGNPPDLRTAHVDVKRTLLFSQGAATNGVPPFQVDHKVFDPNRVDITMKLGSVEEWTLSNPVTGPAAEWHTFHIHQNSFQVISRNGKPVGYIDWQDNVTLAPGETVVVRMHPTDFTGKFVLHCHVIFHEDHGMMATVQVLKNPTPAQVDTHRTIFLRPPSTPAQYADASPADARYGNLLFYCRLLARAT